MGLDMYLYAKKYLSEHVDQTDKSKIEQINAMFGIAGADDYRAQEIEFRVAYWRKANAIHGWFVRNVQDNVDDCQTAYVKREQLQELLNTCLIVLSDHTKAEGLLSTVGGFFFGSTEYDDWYFNDLKATVKQLERALNDPALEKMDFYYHSSW